MRLTRNTLSFVIFFFILVTNLLILFNIQYFYLRAIFSFLFLTTIPGLLILLIVRVRNINFWKYLVYTIGLSVTFIMFVGLAVNWALPWLNVTDKPLSLVPLIISFDTIFLILGILAYIRNKEILFGIKLINLNWLNKIFFTIPVFFVLLSILGAITLNNNGTNYLTMVMLCGIALYTFFIVHYREKLNQNIYPWTILLISISLLLSFSLRSWHISGWDINLEYYIFQLTSQNYHWTMLSAPNNPYNACLSLTILPTVFNSIVGIDKEYVFKLLIQLLAAIIPLNVFLLIKRYGNCIYAFLATFFFMSQPAFLVELPTLIRQEMSLLYFSLLLVVLFGEEITNNKKRLLFLLFGSSMIVSHYSTTYVAIGLFVLTALFTNLFKKTKDNKFLSTIYRKLNLIDTKIPFDKNEYHLNGLLIILLIVFTFYWNNLLTKSSGNLSSFFYDSFRNMSNIYNREFVAEQTSFFDQFNLFYKQEDLKPLLYSASVEEYDKLRSNPNLSLFSATSYKNYTLQIVRPETTDIKIGHSFYSAFYLFGQIVEKLVKIFIILGAAYLIFHEFKNKNVHKEFIVMSIFFVFFITLFTIVPLVSLLYPIERLYQQSLIFLSFSMLTGGLLVFKLLKESLRIFLLTLVIITYFAFLSGLTSQITGGAILNMQLNNSGRTYDQVYTHQAEVSSIHWLLSNRDNYDLVYADRYGEKRIWSYAQIQKDIVGWVIPSTIEKNSYVYASYTNITQGTAFVLIRGREIGYNFPLEFLNDNKNTIYNNGFSGVYK